MKNYLSLGPVRLRISTKYLAPWGYERLAIGGLSLLSRTNGGDLILVAYHPRWCGTWHWSLCIRRGRPEHWVNRATSRRGQWHDYFWLPFGRELIVSRQDYHLDPTIRAAR